VQKKVVHLPADLNGSFMKNTIKQVFVNSFLSKILFVLFIGQIIVSCSNPDNPDTRTLSYAESDKPETIFPHLISKFSEAQIASQIHGNLVALDFDTEDPVPSLAYDWMVNSDFSRFVFYLREDVFFHDDPVFGKEKTRAVTALDVVISIKHFILNCKKHDRPLGFVADIAGVEKFYDACIGDKLPEMPIDGILFSNDHTLVFELYNPNPTFLMGLAAPNMAIMPHEALQNYGRENLIGCGPYKIGKETMNENKWTLTKNKKYVLDTINPAGFDKIEIYYNLSSDKELQMLSEGNINLIFNLSKDHANRFMESNINRFEGSNAEFGILQTGGTEQSALFTLYNLSLNGLKFDSFGVVRLIRIWHQGNR
jgi:ABC-type transport system substrate-binding protein